MPLAQQDILRAVVQEAMELDNQQVINHVRGSSLVGVETTSSAGLCSILPADDRIDSLEKNTELPAFIHTLASGLMKQGTLESSWALAGINSRLNTRASGPERKAQDLIVELGKDKNVAIIGHFPFVHKIKHEFKNFWVMEKRPREFDLPESMLPSVLPRTQVVAITATTLLNSSLAFILNLCPPGCIKILMGPSTPLAFSLFRMGLNYLAGAVVKDKEKVLAGIRENTCFRHLDGIEHFLIHEDNHPAKMNNKNLLTRNCT